jgi:putative acetyltransferase
VVETAAFGRINEARLVDSLRSAGALTFSAVAEAESKVVGHAAFSPVKIEDERGSFEALALAPVAVLPTWQRKGVGSALLKWSLDECRRLGHKLVIVVGHPEYYPRFGFVPATPGGIRCPFDVPSEAFMLLELQPGALAGRTGTIRYRPEFNDV